MTNDYSTAPAPRDAGSPSAAPPPPRLASRLAWGLAAVLFAAFLARLGVWQLSRAHEKTSLAERIAERGRMPPLAQEALARDAVGARAQWERRVALEGRWLADRTVWLVNRSMDEYNGFYVMTPLRLADGRVVLVQRGFAPGDPAHPDKAPPLVTPEGPVRVAGHVAPWPAPRIQLGRAASGPVRQNLAPEVFAAESGLAPGPAIVVEDADAHDGLMRHWVPPTANALTNYGYAAQWFAMSATVLGLYVWLQFLRKPRADDTDDESPAS